MIPTRNRPAGLRASLLALSAQTCEDFEVIVVDDASDVPVAGTIDPALRSQLDITLLANERQRGPSAARNCGVAAARGRYVAFVDDDVRVVPDWLSCHLAAQDSNAPLATIGPLAAPADWHPQAWTWWEADTLARQYRRLRAGRFHATWRQFHTGNAFLERSAILDAGGFDEALLRAEDIELAVRMARRGLTFGFIPEAIGWHYSSRSKAAWLSVARSYGRFDRYLDRRYPDMGWMSLVQRELGWRHPWLRAFRRVADHRFVRPVAVQAAAGVGSAAHTLHLRAVARAALSAAYELEYLRGLSEGPVALVPAAQQS